MDQLRAMQVLVAVAEEEGFAPAAKRLGMSPPAVTRAIAGLEDRLGARLFKRSTRIVRLTDPGERYYADCRRILAEIEAANALVTGAHREPRGEISITSSPTFGRKFVAPMLMDFLAIYPRISVRTVFVNHVVDLIENGLDVAIRLADLPDSDLSAVRIGSVRRVVVASPDYLEKHGTPETPADLMDLQAINFALAPANRQWTFRCKGRYQIVRPSARIVTDAVDLAIRAAVAGCGVARLLSYQIGEELASGTLRVVLSDFEPPPVPIHVVHLDGRRASARIRTFVDFAVERLRNDPAIQAGSTIAGAT